MGTIAIICYVLSGIIFISFFFLVSLMIKKAMNNTVSEKDLADNIMILEWKYPFIILIVGIIFDYM